MLLTTNGLKKRSMKPKTYNTPILAVIPWGKQQGVLNIADEGIEH
jgi:hypothetical protein